MSVMWVVAERRETGLAKGSGKWMREGNKERRKEGTGGGAVGRVDRR